MKNLLILSLVIMITASSYGQTDEIENWRNLGYQAKTENDFSSSITYYQKILMADPADYDARLALARLYVITKEYRTAIVIFNEIYKDDSTDVEALNGLGDCNGKLGQDKKSVFYFEKALFFLPDNVQQHLYLARAYGNAGDLEKAIEVYRGIMLIDDTYSEAWAGIGRMYYWMGKPKSAVVYYEKALNLDPQNEEIKNEYLEVKSELSYALSFKSGPVKEIEENYEIDALISKVRIEKRIGDHFQIEANFLLDYSNRDFIDDSGDTARWYNSSWIKASRISKHHTISVFGGYSNTDNKISTYGLEWKLNYSAGRFTIKNSINAGYDYFYYWNEVGGKSIADEAQLTFGIFGLNARYTYGRIDPVIVFITGESLAPHQNPYQAYGVSLSCKILKRPDIRISLNHSYLNYEYKSPKYYSPLDRTLTGASTSIYYSFLKLYFYGSFAYNIGTEYNIGELKNVKMDVDNWSSNLELGYNHYPFSFSIGGSNFYNPYYQNITGFIAVKILF